MIGVDDISYIYVPLVIGELPQRSSFHLGTGALHHREHLVIQLELINSHQGCISCGTCSYLELTEDHVLTSAYVKIFRIVTRNAVNKSF